MNERTGEEAVVTVGTATPAPAEAGREERRSGDSPLAMRVYEGLRAQIVSGELRPEQKLLGEHQLAAVFLVSRPVVREALQRLRDEGLISSRRGAGSFVKARPSHEGAIAQVGFAPVETIADIQRCYEFRLSIEPDHAHWAALRRNDHALQAIEAAVGLMRDATVAHQHREDADFAFHCAIAEATNNHYFASSMVALRDHIHVGMKVHGVSLLGPRRGLENVFREHVEIFEAIRARDAQRAKEAMRRHLEGSRDRVFEGRTLDLSL